MGTVKCFTVAESLHLYASVCIASAAWSFAVPGSYKGLGYPTNLMVLATVQRAAWMLLVYLLSLYKSSFSYPLSK